MDNVPGKEIITILCAFYAPEAATLSELDTALEQVQSPPAIDGQNILKAMSVLSSGKLLISRAREIKSSLSCLGTVVSDAAQVEPYTEAGELSALSEACDTQEYL